MRREFHVRFCEGAGVQFPRATRRNVYVRSVRAGERVMAGLRKLYARMHLRVNDAKSAVAKATTRPFLGYRFFMRRGEVQCAVAPKAWMAMKERVRQLTARSRGRSLPQIAEELRSYLPGWRAYFRLAQTPAAFRDLDEWIRHRLRMAQLRQWKRGTTTYRALCARGTSASLARIVAANARRWCRNSGTALNLAMPNAYFDALGLPRMVT